MPRDFGDWFNDAKPLDFQDPTPEAPRKPIKGERAVLPVSPDAHLYEGYVVDESTPLHKCDGKHGGRACADPQCWQGQFLQGIATGSFTITHRRAGKSVLIARNYLERRGFTYNIAKDAMVTHCLRCLCELEVPVFEALGYANRHARHGTDPRLCAICNSKLGGIKKYP